MLTWSTDAPEYQQLLPDDDMLYIRQCQAAVQFKSLRIVEGVDYTEYTGEYATKSYSGHDDPIETTEDDPTEDTEPTIDSETTEDSQGSVEGTTGAADSGEAEKKGCKGAITTLPFVSILALGSFVALAKKRK